jgi:hypothetical protein
MALPSTIPVKLSSEGAGSIAITPVVVQQLTPSELIEHLLGITGKDEARIREILRRGTLVSGGSRFRWPGWDPDPDGLHEVVARFPDPDPSRPFSAERCLRAILCGGRQAVELPRELIARKRLLERRSFWDLLMEVTGITGVAYRGYSYRDRGDRYVREFSVDERERLQAGALGITVRSLRDQVRGSAFSQAELYATRQNSEAGAD